MLSHIYIRNFAIIEALDLDLHTGLTALTGETGAGKSILLDAIGLVLGDRADSSVVRYGAKKAEISLTVDVQQLPQAQQWLQAQGLNNGEHDEQCLLRRTISRTGQSRAWINGTPSTLTTLRQLGGQLVDIHGQHEHQSLMKKEAQRDLLDAYADHIDLQKKTYRAYQTWQDRAKRLQHLRAQDSHQQERLELLNFQYQELAALQLQANEVAELEADYARLSHANDLLQTCESVCQQSYESDQAIYSQLSALIHQLGQKTHLDQAFSEPQELLTQAQIQVQEAASLLRHHADRIILDPERLLWLEERLQSIQSLARKHRIEPEQLFAFQAQLAEALEHHDNRDQQYELLEQQVVHAEAAYYHVAEQLSKQRQKAANDLAHDVSAAMQALGMQGGQFFIALKLPHKPHAFGLEHIEFQVSANPGQPLNALHKVASGGELSRISLAIQMIAARRVAFPAFIFDEVDTGVGGGIAEVIGKQLRRLGENGENNDSSSSSSSSLTKRQVLCVTHLPQVAAQAHHHYKVTKIKTAERTTTRMIYLDQQARIDEIARMMGGIEITPTTLKLAKEMVCLPKKPKNCG
ncbi:MAG TPA: DNA repair protein RecN [Thiothrix sp.]|nr:DNA repair protein RecN [Thiothrix sp.]